MGYRYALAYTGTGNFHGNLSISHEVVFASYSSADFTQRREITRAPPYRPNKRGLIRRQNGFQTSRFSSSCGLGNGYVTFFEAFTG